jgi:nitrate reductase beta subunit
VKYSTIQVPIAGIKNLCRLGRIVDNIEEIMSAIQALTFPATDLTSFFTSGEMDAITSYIVRRGKLSSGKMSST